MPTATYIPLQTITLGSAAATVTFGSIPSSYRDLVLVFDGAGSGSGDLHLSANSDTANNYSNVQMGGNGTSAYSSTFSTSGFYATQLLTGRTTTKVQLLDYSATDKHKTALIRFDNTGSTNGIASRWANTAAINNLACRAIGTTFASGSTFSLYGIA